MPSIATTVEQKRPRPRHDLINQLRHTVPLSGPTSTSLPCLSRRHWSSSSADGSWRRWRPPTPGRRCRRPLLLLRRLPDEEAALVQGTGCQACRFLKQDHSQILKRPRGALHLAWIEKLNKVHCKRIASLIKWVQVLEGGVIAQRKYLCILPSRTGFGSFECW